MRKNTKIKIKTLSMVDFFNYTKEWLRLIKNFNFKIKFLKFLSCQIAHNLKLDKYGAW